MVLRVNIRSKMSAQQSTNQQIPIAEPLVEVRRGAITESRHRGHIVVVEPDGNIVRYLGSPENVTFLRSSAKPFQALPLVVSGAAEKFGFTDEEVAFGVRLPQRRTDSHKTCRLDAGEDWCWP